MPADSPPTPELASVDVADDRDVEPLLRRAAADLSALTLRLGAATHRADAAEARADAAGAPDGGTLEDEATELRRQLQQEEADHRSRLDVELDRARAEAAEVIDTARAAAVEIVRAASIELDVAVATSGGSRTPRPIDTPVEPAVVEQPGPSFMKRVLPLDAVPPLLWVALVLIVLILLFVWVR